MNKIKLILFCLLTGVALIGCSSSKDNENTSNNIQIRADYPFYEDAASICDKAELAVKVKVIDVEPNVVINFSMEEEPMNLPTTLYTFEVLDVLKGEYEDSNIIVPVIGGTMDGEDYVSEANIIFDTDKEYLLLLETHDNSYPTLLSDTQAYFEYGKKETKTNSNPFTLDDVLYELNK